MNAPAGPSPAKRPACDTSLIEEEPRGSAAFSGSDSQQQPIQPSATPTRPSAASTLSSATPPPAKKRQIDLTGHLISTSVHQKQDLDQALAELLYATRTPFTFVNHPLFKKFCNMMRPGYIPPTDKQIGGQHLDHCTDRLQADMKQHVQDKPTTIQQDGWTNIKEDPIIATSLCADGQGYFNDAVDPGSKKKTADYCADLLLKSIDKAENEYKAEVLNCVTDNENKMNKTREEVHKARPDINVYGCMAHNLNNLGKDLTPTAVMEHVKEVNKAFKNIHQLHGWLKECPGHVKPQLPNDTRWCSRPACLRTYVHNFPHYKKIANEHRDEMDPGLVKKINNIAILANAQDLLDQLSPIADALNRIQSDDCMIAEATHIYLSLLDVPALEPHKDAILKATIWVRILCHRPPFVALIV